MSTTNISDINYLAYVSSVKTQLFNTWNSTGLTIADVIAIVFIISVFFYIVSVKIEFVDLNNNKQSISQDVSDLASHIETSISGLYEAKTNETNKKPSSLLYIDQIPYPQQEYAWWNFLKVNFD